VARGRRDACAVRRRGRHPNDAGMRAIAEAINLDTL
jgi:hypothetical protein